MKVKQVLSYTIGLLSILVASTAEAASLSFLPTSTAIRVGQTTEVAIRISDLQDHSAPSLASFDLSVLFDPTIARVETVLFGDPVLGDQVDRSGLAKSLNSPAFPTIQSNITTNGTSGIVNLSELSLDASTDLDLNQPANFTLARILFKALHPGITSLSFSEVFLGTSQGKLLMATPSHGTLSVLPQLPVEPVPESSSLNPLLISIIVGGLWQLCGLESGSAKHHSRQAMRK